MTTVETISLLFAYLTARYAQDSDEARDIRQVPHFLTCEMVVVSENHPCDCDAPKDAGEDRIARAELLYKLARRWYEVDRNDPNEAAWFGAALAGLAVPYSKRADFPTVPAVE